MQHHHKIATIGIHGIGGLLRLGYRFMNIEARRGFARLAIQIEVASVKNSVRQFTLATLVGVSVLVTGCAQQLDEATTSEFVDNTEPADKLYNEALANIDAGNIREAQKKFSAVDKQHPYSRFAQRSLVMLSFTNYRQGAYDEAVSHAKRYLSLYPGSEDAAYAQYLIGMSYHKRIPVVTRDLKDARRSFNAFNELVNRYPESEYADDAKLKMRFARDQIAGKEMQVGRYYLERKEYLAAINRFRKVVENYQTTRQVEEALARLTESYMALGLVNEAQTAAAVLGHNFPDSQWYSDSYKLLTAGGVQPRENRNSWISRAGKLITG